MSRFRQTVLLLLVLLLAAGPALAVAPEAGCTAGVMDCPACCHPAQEMQGMAGMQARHPTPGHGLARAPGVRFHASVQAPGAACLCAAHPVPVTPEALAVSTQAVRLAVPAVESLWWPPLPASPQRARAASVIHTRPLPISAPLPLRI